MSPLHWRRIRPARVLVFSSLMLLAAGCGPTEKTRTAEMPPPATRGPDRANANVPMTANPASEQHAHQPGSHGGAIVSIGLDSYHAEAVFEKGGTLKLLMLGKDESRVLEVESQQLKAYAKAAGSTEAIPFDVLPVPQDGDAAGKTSQFVGQIPESVIGQALDVTIPSLRIEGERFRVGFTSRIDEHAAGGEAMPGGVSGTEERDLYLTPGGKYTLADIAANGNVTAPQKFKGVVANHDLKPKPGDRICPVTLTKANPKFPWVIDGQSYLFCCPPCVDEFVKLAKERPDELPAADSFVKK